MKILGFDIRAFKQLPTSQSFGPDNEQRTTTKLSNLWYFLRHVKSGGVRCCVG